MREPNSSWVVEGKLQVRCGARRRFAREVFNLVSGCSVWSLETRTKSQQATAHTLLRNEKIAFTILPARNLKADAPLAQLDMEG